MLPLAAISLGVSAAGAATSWWNRLGQADQMRRETDEALRRLRLVQEQKLGAAAAAGAASGVTADSASLTRHLSAMSGEFRREAEWAAAAGYGAAGATSKAAGFGLATDIAGSLFRFGESNAWFRQPSLPAAPTYSPGTGMPLWR
jgi:hypothetical protein